ncbi:MAG TPA: DNA-processing protein DprA [Gemmatimonadales bacterium]|nr:DNA-processing protein DprA [Gemmatimonadales bacterium]
MTAANDREREAYVTLALVPGIGAVRLKALLDRFDTPSGALSAPLELLRSVSGMNRAAATAVTLAHRASGRRAIAALEEIGGHLLLPADPGFPPQLLDIPDPPTCLFAQGNLHALELPAVAVVGSRDHSPYGAEVCRGVARAAAQSGLAVVSGMARGLDAVAHAGALEATGLTVGVLGNGLGVIYPSANRELYQRVADRGLLLSEFPPGERPNAGSFPRRNRLISGLARVTVVVEAAISSGALQTVGCALEQGRDVMAVPGPITSPVSAGTNRLIRDGAAPLLELADLLTHYPEAARAITPSASAEPGALAPVEGRIVNALWAGPRRVEELVEATGAPVWAALDALSVLELGGRIRQEAGGLYRLVTPSLFK